MGGGEGEHLFPEGRATNLFQLEKIAADGRLDDGVAQIAVPTLTVIPEGYRSGITSAGHDFFRGDGLRNRDKIDQILRPPRRHGQSLESSRHAFPGTRTDLPQRRAGRDEVQRQLFAPDLIMPRFRPLAPTRQRLNLVDQQDDHPGGGLFLRLAPHRIGPRRQGCLRYIGIHIDDRTCGGPGKFQEQGGLAHPTRAHQELQLGGPEVPPDGGARCRRRLGIPDYYRTVSESLPGRAGS